MRLEASYITARGMWEVPHNKINREKESSSGSYKSQPDGGVPSGFGLQVCRDKPLPSSEACH